MNILSLNVRGLGDSSKRRHLATFIKRGKFDVICFQETKRETFSVLFLHSFGEL